MIGPFSEPEGRRTGIAAAVLRQTVDGAKPGGQITDVPVLRTLFDGRARFDTLG